MSKMSAEKTTLNGKVEQRHQASGWGYPGLDGVKCSRITDEAGNLVAICPASLAEELVARINTGPTRDPSG